MNDAHPAREAMVRSQIARRGIRDPRVLEALRSVPREAFVPSHLAASAFDDRALPLDCGQTISQPYVVAVMIEALLLDRSSRVLEVGTGSGYAAALLATLAAEVWTIERHEALARSAEERLKHLGYASVHVHTGDGTQGLLDAAPFDAILVSAGAPAPPPSLLYQLDYGGRMVVPVGDERTQELVQLVLLEDGNIRRKTLGGVHFVPLVGAEGWLAPDEVQDAGRSRGSS